MLLQKSVRHGRTKILAVDLVRFEFLQKFTEMIRTLHDGTMARFVVDGELSEPLKLVSGIRQVTACSVVFVFVAVGVLALAIQQDFDQPLDS